MPTKSWRDVLPIHPAADLFPRMSESELAALAEDIKANGLKSPVVLWVPGSPNDYPDDSDPPRYVLDGINRLDAMERAGIQLVENDPTDPDPFTNRLTACSRDKYESDTDPYAYVISANIHRRHLTAEQKRDLIAKLIKAQPEKSDRQIAGTVKASPTTVGTVRAEMEAKGDVSKLDTRTDSRGTTATGDPPPDQAEAEHRANRCGPSCRPTRRRGQGARQCRPRRRPQSWRDHGPLDPRGRGRAARIRPPHAARNAR
jgi:hypothetical protein